MAGAIVGVDASRNRSGGAVAHIRGLVTGADPTNLGVGAVHLWAHDQLLDQLPEMPWLAKHRVPDGGTSIGQQLLWQRRELPRIARDLGVTVMFNTDAGSVCSFQPSATLSQDMLSFEPGEMQRYGWTTRDRLRLEALRVVQLARLRRSTTAIFLSEHARRIIASQTRLPHTAVIPHGIDARFRAARHERAPWPAGEGAAIRCLYVSNAALYKHQWHVVEAVARLRQGGLPVTMRLVGGGSGIAMDRLRSAIAVHDPAGQFIETVDFIANERIPAELAACHVFVFASSCENLPITLLEAMASGAPIACSNRGPMPEVLGPDGVYFDPEKPAEIASAIERLVRDEGLRAAASRNALGRADLFTWERCARDTWTELARISRSSRSRKSP